jgi:Integrase zinc binding domain
VVPEDPEIHREVLKMYHDHPTAGHPSIMQTLALVAKDYWWPTMWEFITNYVKGCAICQQTKSGTTKPRILLIPITPKQANTPFTTVTLDLITDLPESQGYDCVLTVMDHDCSKAAIFTPCHKTIDSEGMARLYAKEVFPYYGLPHRVISDWDSQFTSKWTTELCCILGVDQNISTAYHPQTNGQSKHTNQWLEQYLWIYGNFQQNDCVMWLPMAQFVYNSWENKTTKRTPFDLLMGHTPDVRKCNHLITTPEVEQRIKWLEEKRWQAHSVMQRAQDLLLKRNQQQRGHKAYWPFEEEDKVWLEGKNLHMSHPFPKLSPKHYGPFLVEQVINPMVFKLIAT